MTPTTPGLHHVTAIAGDPQRNADFYVSVLGLRFVKRTVNHDDPGTYHFYFGDGEGTPGTNITFFPWTKTGRKGQFGAGQAETVAYTIPESSVDYWTERLESEGVAVEQTERLGETVLQFEDPDGIGLELVASEPPDAAVSWDGSPVPESHQLRGLHSVTLAVESVEPTAALLTDILGYSHEATADGRHRYRAAGELGTVIDIVETDIERGRMGVGTVHHVAVRADDIEELAAYKEAYAEQDINASAILDRTYFHALYARGPGQVLFEISTAEPGFTADEELSELGTSLVLPEQLEPDRESIESQLPEFDTAWLPGV